MPQQQLSKKLRKVILLFSLVSSAIGSSFTEPHDHNGVVKPFSPGDPKIPLNKKALSILLSNKPYQTQIQSGAGGRGLVVQDVNAPKDIVWGRILDYDSYSKMVPKTIESKNYKVENKKPSKKNPLSQIIYTRMKVGFPVLKLEFFIKHLYYPEMNSLTWTLDYSKKSDFNDSCGFWFVIPHPDDPHNKTRLFYSVEVSMFDWVPKFVVDFMSTKALTDATTWVKKYSEAEFYNQSTRQIFSKKSFNADKNSTNKKRKKTIFKRLQFWDKSEEIELRWLAEEAKRVALERKHTAEEEEAKRKIFISWVRLTMASAVFALAIYNVHLGFSH